MKDSLFSRKSTLNIRGKILDLSSPKIMGILNITPDSFYSKSRVESNEDIIKLANQMLSEGADMLDIGAYSSRPGAQDISTAEEINRASFAIDAIISNFPGTIISIDTFRSEVAKYAIEAGASIVNDISGGNLDDRMFDTVAELKCPYILMHMRGTPKTMNKKNLYSDVALEVLTDLEKKVYKLRSKDVVDIIIDPGIGFAKSGDQNYEILKNLNYLKALQLPVLVGVSRKSFIYKTLDTNPENALNGSTVMHTLALQNGAQILRVHDVKEAVEVVNLVTKYESA